MDDASLDEFVTEGDDGEDEPTPTGAATDPAEGTATGSSPVELATSTYAWTGNGAACGACGESVARRWQDEDALVCADCKEW